MKSLQTGIFFLLLTFASLLSVQAQVGEVTARLEFLADTFSLGRPVPLRLEVTHPADVMVFTPRGKKDFFPFELIEMEPEPTRTSNGVSTDAVVYYLSTFHLGQNQSINLTISYRKATEEVMQTIDVRSDSVQLIERIPRVSELLTYRSHETLPPLVDPPNFVLIFFVILALALLAGITSLWLRGPIARYLRIRKVKNEWNKITRRIQQLLDLQTDQANLVSLLNRVWKGYLDPRGKYALLSMTTTELIPAVHDLPEIHAAEQDAFLQMARIGDDVIYAGRDLSTEQTLEFGQQIHDLLFDVYQRRVKKVSGRTDYTQQFFRKLKRLLLADGGKKTMWKGY